MRYLRVAKDWAFITGDPQSADGKQHYEAESALLHKVNERWGVVDQPCAEADCDEHAEIAHAGQVSVVRPRSFRIDRAMRSAAHA